MAKKYDFSAFKKPAGGKEGKKYNFSAFQTPEAKPAAPEMEQSEALRRGVAQGGAMGFADEAGGKIQQFLDYINGNQITNTDAQLAAQGFKGDLTPTSEQFYEKTRDEERAADKAAMEQHPGTFIAGNVAGSIPLSMVGGAGMLGKGVQSLSTAKGIIPAAKMGAATGAITGLGNSESESLGGMAADSAMSAGLGGLLGGTIAGAGKVVGATKDAIKGVRNIGLVDDAIQAGEHGLQGTSILTRADYQAAEGAVEESAKSLGFLAKDLGKEAGQEIGRIKEALRASGKTFDISNEVSAIDDLIVKLRTSKNPINLKDADYLEEYVKNIKLGVSKPQQVQYNQYTPQQVVKGAPSAAEKLAEEAAKAKEQARVLGQNLNTEIVENTDDEGRKLLTLLKSQDEQVGGAERVLLDEEGAVAGMTPGNTADNFNSSATAKTVIDKATPDQIIPAQAGPLVTETIETRVNPTNLAGASIDEAKDIQSTLTGFGKLGKSAPPLSSESAQGAVKTIAGKIGANIDENAGNVLLDGVETSLPQANSKASAAKDVFSILGIKPKDFKTNPHTGERELTHSAEQKLTEIIRRSDKDTSTGANAKKVIDKIVNLLNPINPEKTGVVAKEARRAANVYDLAQKSEQLGFMNKSTYLKSIPIKIGNSVGLGINALNKATGGQLQQVAERAATMGKGGRYVAKILSDAANKDNVGRNALLFTLEQTPEYRQIIKDILGEDESNK